MVGDGAFLVFADAEPSALGHEGLAHPVLGVRLADRSHWPDSYPHQMPEVVESLVAELHRIHRSGGRSGIATEIARGDPDLGPSVSAVYRRGARLLETGLRGTEA
jgi:hypothetical protein